MVGCVIVHNDEVVASGFHEQYGGPHAEVNAINALPDKIQAAHCTLYVTLEPCSHHGKTPPCADLIMSKGFKKVVVASTDPNPLVAGEGIKRLKNAGIEVMVGVLEKEARVLNKRFFTFFEQKRPFFILKWAQTEDGFISRIGVPKTREGNKISGIEADVMVHQLRAQCQGILVGKNTVLYDNPTLTTRLVKGNNPTRMFIDRKLEVPFTFNIYNSEAKTLVFNEVKDKTEDNIQFIKIDFDKNVLGQLASRLYELKIQNVLVEGGTFLIDQFIGQNLWDEIMIFQNPQLYFAQGVKAPAIALKNNFELVGNDKLYRYFRENKT